MHVPQNVDLKSAAAIPEVWLTAFQLLHVLGKLKAGERVLIHAGGSGVGTAAVQLTQLAGATSLVTAGTDEKLSMAQSLGASAGFNYKSQGTVFSDWVLERTKGKVHVLFASSSTRYGPSKGVSCVASHLFCSCTVACSTIQNITVIYEQKLNCMLVWLYCMQFVTVTNCRNFSDNFCCLSALSKWSVATFSDCVVCQGPWYWEKSLGVSWELQVKTLVNESLV